MDTSRWKSILVPRVMYEEVKMMSEDEGRTISGQLRMIFQKYKEQKTDGITGRGTNPPETYAE